MKIPKGDWDTPGPCWIPMQNQDGTPAKPAITCRCGQYMSIGLHHVHADGRVTASFFHSPGMGPDACGFHEFLELEGYDGPEHLPRKSPG